MSAMLMSVMMRSYGPRGSSRMASKPLLASTTSHAPNPVVNASSSRMALTNARAAFESSTTSTLRMLPRVADLAHRKGYLSAHESDKAPT